MKLTDLIKKESERTNQEIKFPKSTAAVASETPKKVFKKERVWLDDSEEVSAKPSENQSSTINQKTITEPSIKKPSINSQPLENHQAINRKAIDKPSRKPSKNQSSTINQKTIKFAPSSVVGNEAGLLSFVVDECSKNGALKTGKITTDVLKALFSLNANGIANLIFRVKEKGLVDIIEQKLGRVSYRIFSVSKEVYDHFKSPENHQAINSQPLENHQATNRKAIDKPSRKPSNTDFDSSKLDFKEENLLTIRIPETIKSLISQREVNDLLAKKLLSEEELQSCLEHFAFDFERNAVRAKTSPINLLYGLVRSGKKYRSIKLIELENQELREYERSLQAVEAENERLKMLDLKIRFDDFKNKNPGFLEKVRAKHSFITSDELLEKVAIQEFSRESSTDTSEV